MTALLKGITTTGAGVATELQNSSAVILSGSAIGTGTVVNLESKSFDGNWVLVEGGQWTTASGFSMKLLRLPCGTYRANVVSGTGLNLSCFALDI